MKAVTKKAREGPPSERRSAHNGGSVPWVFVTPAMAVFSCVLLIPSFIGFGYSFTQWDGLSDPRWIGLENFSELLVEPTGKGVLAHTFSLAIIYILGVNVLGLGLAVGMNNVLRTRALLRALFFLPAVMSPLVVAYIWKYIFDANGSLNEGLEAIGLDTLTRGWLGQPTLALLAVAVVMIWQFSGYHMLIYTAGLQGAQVELQEAAAVDGASNWRRFRDITLPLMLPTIVVSVALSTITGLMVFDQVMALTGGGPAGATDTLGTFVYKQAFANGRYGYSAAIALVLVAVVSAAAVVQILALRRRPD